MLWKCKNANFKREMPRSLLCTLALFSLWNSRKKEGKVSEMSAIRNVHECQLKADRGMLQHPARKEHQMLPSNDLTSVSMTTTLKSLHSRIAPIMENGGEFRHGGREPGELSGESLMGRKCLTGRGGAKIVFILLSLLFFISFTMKVLFLWQAVTVFKVKLCI